MPHKCEKISWFYLLLLSKLKRSFRIFLKFFFAFSEYLIFTVKVHVFWECHKNWQNLHCQFAWQYVVTVKSMVKILSIFVAFLENMNFTYVTNVRKRTKSEKKCINFNCIKKTTGFTWPISNGSRDISFVVVCLHMWAWVGYLYLSIL